MSSREIADLVESRHDSVKRAIERLVERAVIGLPPLVGYLDSLNRKATEYQIGKRGVIGAPPLGEYRELLRLDSYSPNRVT